MCKWNQLISFIGSILWSVFPPIVPLILSYILCRKLMRIEAANETNRDVMLNNLLWNSFLKNSTHLPVCNLWTAILGPCFCLPWSMTTHLTDDNLRHKEMLHFKLKFWSLSPPDCAWLMALQQSVWQTLHLKSVIFSSFRFQATVSFKLCFVFYGL